MERFQFFDIYNVLIGCIIGFLTALLNHHVVLFALFLFFNIMDWLSGWMKAYMTKTVNSIKGLKGIIKKLGYWLLILMAFCMSYFFIEIGRTLNIDLEVTTLLGWFVLVSLIVNEIRSILENFVEAGFQVPQILIKGLEVANKYINKENEE